MKMQNNYNPDVLSCLASLSNDEVFTPPKLANEILDLLPKEIWKDKEATFIDPVAKSGVFLREISKRLLEGLENEIPNLQKRIDHVYTKQIFGIGITEMTALLSRRSVYCTKEANHKKYAICTEFNDNRGNIFFDETNHDWKNDRCSYCGASQSEYAREQGLETHAYQFIHNNLNDKIKNMKFDVIIGNPPYQLNDGGGTGDSAKPIYHLFIQQAKKLNPKYLAMIIPSRWMKGGKGLDSFREEMINDKRIRYIKDYEDAKECFSGINLDGGVCYFLWDSSYNSAAEFHYKPKGLEVIISKRYLKNDFSKTVTRDWRQISIIQKVNKVGEKKFSEIVSTRKPYGIATDLFNSPSKYGYASIPTQPFKNSYKIYGVVGNKGGAKRKIGYIDKLKVLPNDSVLKYKLFQSYAYTTTSTVPPEIIIGSPNEVCTETFLVFGPFFNRTETENCLQYTKTKFYRALLFFNRIQKNLSQSTFSLIPVQDFTLTWSDEELYKKYQLKKEEIEYIESLIKPMS